MIARWGSFPNGERFAEERQFFIIASISGLLTERVYYDWADNFFKKKKKNEEF